MNHEATTFTQAVGGPPEVIGYDPKGASQKAFAHGWNAARDLLYRFEQQAIGDSIVEELEIGKYPHDFTFIDHGSLIGLLPVSPAGRAWVDENLPDDAPRMGRSVMIEWRFWASIADGIANDGLVVMS